MKQNGFSNYLKDAANVLTHAESKADQGDMEEEESKYAILRFCDSTSSDRHKPIVGKTRLVVEEGGYQSIIWPLRIDRHFVEPLKDLKAAIDTPWHEEKSAIVWRGKPSGTNS